MKRRWIPACALLTIAASVPLGGCGGSGGAPHARTIVEAAPGDPNEPPPAKTLFTAKSVASLFSYPQKLTMTEAQVGPEWSQKGKIVWSIAFVADDDTFAPVTMILFDGHYRGLTISDDQKDLLRRSHLFKDLDFGHDRPGYAMRATGDAGAAEETTLVISPRGRYELLVLVDVPKGGPIEAPGTEAYRALLMDYSVRLVETVARGLDATWSGKP